MREVKISELRSFVDSIARELMKVHERRFGDRARALRDAASGLGNAAGRLSTGVKNQWGTLDKQTSEYAIRLAQSLQESAETLTRSNPSHEFQGTETFHQEAVRILNDIILTVRKYVPKIPKTLRLEMTILNSSLTKLERAVRDLGNALDQSPGSKLQSLQRDIENITEKHAQLSNVRSAEHEVATSLDEALAREKQLTSQSSSINSLPEFVEFRSYEGSLEQKENEIRQFLQPAAKPLLKLERSRATKKGEALDIKTLHDVIEEPIATVVAGQLFAVNQLFEDLGTALSNQELDLEDRKRRKAEDVIEAVKGSALEKLRGEYLALQVNTQESLRQLKSKGLLEERDALAGQLEEARGQTQLIRTRQMELHRRNEELSKSLTKLKGSVEAQISKLGRQSVDIAID